MCFSSNSYLFNCDLLYRLKSRNVYALPKIKQASLRMSTIKLMEILNMYALSSFSEKSTQISLYLFYYLTFLKIPFISLKRALARNETKLEKTYLRIFLCNRQMATLFFEFNFFLQSFLLDSFNKSKLFNKKSFFVKLDLNNISGIEFYSRNLLLLADLTDIDFQVNIKV